METDLIRGFLCSNDLMTVLLGLMNETGWSKDVYREGFCICADEDDNNSSSAVLQF
jgi:hypothetical protein